MPRVVVLSWASRLASLAELGQVSRTHLTGSGVVPVVLAVGMKQDANIAFFTAQPDLLIVRQKMTVLIVRNELEGKVVDVVSGHCVVADEAFDLLTPFIKG